MSCIKDLEKDLRADYNALRDSVNILKTERSVFWGKKEIDYGGIEALIYLAEGIRVKSGLPVKPLKLKKQNLRSVIKFNNKLSEFIAIAEDGLMRIASVIGPEQPNQK